MKPFLVHTHETAPEASRGTLEKIRRAFGFVPNLMGVLAESPAALEAYVGVADAFDRCSLGAREKQVVLLTVSVENGCEYCVAAHSLIAAKSGLPEESIAAVRSKRPLSDAKLEAVHRFTRTVVGTRGRSSEAELQAFLAAGFSNAQILEIVVGVAQKTLSNYVNHMAGTPLDAAFESARWSAAAAQSAER